jgi:4-amino-4-deoxy-L-arabinose transferase-like glycosyltransferase
MFQRYFNLSPFIAFLPLALLYAVVVMVRGSEVVYGDEERYLKLAENLCHGFYSPPQPNINLWSGPGYPLIVAPFIYFGLSQFWITMLNVVFQYLSVVFLFKALRLLVDLRIAAIASIGWALMYNAWLWEMPLVSTEPLTVCLCAMIAFTLLRSHHSPEKKTKNRFAILTGILLGYLVLTKIIFGYVLLATIAISLLAFLMKRTAIRSQLMKISLYAILINLPYLIYTHSLTDKLFYWGNSGGLSLYWMSTPYPTETGDWHGLELYQPAQKNSEVALNHQKDFEYLSQFTGVQLDDELKKMAMQNIRDYPGKYVQNCFFNISRLLFDAPYYFASPTNMYVFRILPMLVFLPLLLFAIWKLLTNFKNVPGALRYLILVMLFYFGMTVLLSAYHRQFYVMIPWMIILIVYVFSIRKKKSLHQGL